jgi:hypothetical protein
MNTGNSNRHFIGKAETRNLTQRKDRVSPARTSLNDTPSLLDGLGLLVASWRPPLTAACLAARARTSGSQP